MSCSAVAIRIVRHSTSRAVDGGPSAPHGLAMPTDLPSDPPEEAPIAAYAQRPRPLGREVRFALRPGVLEVDDQRRVVRLPLSAIRSATLTYEPRNTMTRGFRLRLGVDGRRSFSFTNTSWRSLMDAENQGPAFRAFVAALLPAIAAANPACAFRGGRSWPVWIALMAATVATFAGLSYMMWRALPQAQTGAALLIAGFAAAFVWIVVRNRPRAFPPGAPPADLLP
jgi:hypothetical protein